MFQVFKTVLYRLFFPGKKGRRKGQGFYTRWWGIAIAQHLSRTIQSLASFNRPALLNFSLLTATPSSLDTTQSGSYHRAQEARGATHAGTRRRPNRDRAGVNRFRTAFYINKYTSSISTEFVPEKVASPEGVEGGGDGGWRGSGVKVNGYFYFSSKIIHRHRLLLSQYVRTQADTSVNLGAYGKRMSCL